MLALTLTEFCDGSLPQSNPPRLSSVPFTLTIDKQEGRRLCRSMPAIAGFRLAPTFGRDPLQTSARQMRGVRPPSWKNGLPLGRRALVGSREEAVARRTRQTTPAATRAVAVEGDDSVDARGPRLLASRSRPNQQPTLKPEGVLPALPHVARPAGAPAPALVHVVPAQSTRRPGSVSVEAGVTATSLDLWRADAYEARRLQTARPRREVERIPAHDRRALPPRRCSRPAPPSISRRNRLRLWGGRASRAPSLSGRRCRGRRHRRPESGSTRPSSSRASRA